MKLKKMLLVFNPRAGQGIFVQNLYEVVEKFTSHGFLVTAYPTQQRRDAYKMAVELGPEYSHFVCCGGDGTFNEAVDGLMVLKKNRPAFGYIPSGTTNDFAYSLGIPDDPLLAAEAICTGEPFAIDIGHFQNECFSYVAAFGLFTDVSYGTPQDMKNMLGHAAYVLEGVRRLTNIKSWYCDIVCDGEEISGEFVFGMVTNSLSIGGFKLPIDRAIHQGDGLFALILLKKLTKLPDLQVVIGALTGNRRPSDNFIVRVARTVTVRSAEPMDWTLDGEYGGNHQEAHIEISRQALEVIVPAKESGTEEA